MAIMRWDPWRDLLAMQREFTKLFDTAFGGDSKVVSATAWSPAIDMFERDDELVVRAELPGMKADDIEVSIVDDRLRIRGERKFKEEVKEDNFYRMEHRYGLYERTIVIPVKVKTEDIKATFDDGVLEITLPKVKEEEPKQIKINVEKK